MSQRRPPTTTFVALLRGIGPMDPRMRNANLVSVCQGLGLEDVRTVIASGNVVFRAPASEAPGLEARLEAAWPERLGFESTTIVRSHAELAQLVEMAPFGELQHSPRSYLLITFAKHQLSIVADFPQQTDHPAAEVIGATHRELFSVTDTSAPGTPDVMRWIERHFGKQLTSRTWLTVGRILERMS